MIAKIKAFLEQIAALLLSFLPDSPFKSFIESMEQAEWLGYLNWFVPVGNFIKIGMAWVAAIAIFYAYQMILRWAKAVGD